MKEMIKGKGAVGVAIAYYALRGMVSIPLAPCQYNLIFDDGIKLNKVSVISCSFKNPSGVYSACIRTMGGNYPNQEATKFDCDVSDFIFVVTDDFTLYSIPSKEIASKRQISLKVYDQFKVTIPS